MEYPDYITEFRYTPHNINTTAQRITTLYLRNIFTSDLTEITAVISRVNPTFTSSRSIPNNLSEIIESAVFLVFSIFHAIYLTHYDCDYRLTTNLSTQNKGQNEKEFY